MDTADICIIYKQVNFISKFWYDDITECLIDKMASFVFFEIGIESMQYQFHCYPWIEISCFWESSKTL